MLAMDFGMIAFQFVIFLLVVLFLVSLILFIRRILINQGTTSKNSTEIDQKLDKIIALLEKEKSDE